MATWPVRELHRPTTCSTRFHQSRRARAAPFSVTPDTSDAFVYQDEYVHFLDEKYPGAFAATQRPPLAQPR